MHQSARLLNHISLFHLRINKIWTLTSAQTISGPDLMIVLKTGAPPQFLKDLSVWSLVCAAGTAEVLRVYDGSFVCSGASVSRLRVSCSSTSSFHSLLPCLFCTFSYIFSHLSSSTFPVGLYPPSSSFVTAVELYSNLDL